MNGTQAPQAGTAGPPSTWVLLGDKAGDNRQVQIIEEALGWPCEHKHIQVLDRFVYGKPRVGPTLYHIDRERSAPLEPPWPDLIITSGRRPANVALWIRRQSRGHTRIVLVGKPSGMMKEFALIVASSENQFPPLARTVSIALPLMRVDAQAVETARAAWEARMAGLPRPLVAILVGGPTNPFVYNRRAGRRLVELARQVVRETGGTPYVTTSRRTPPRTVAALRAGLPDQGRLFVWGSEGEENPYLGLLAHADGFAVTGDSISMITEIVRLHRPLAIIPLPTGVVGTADQLRRSFARWLFRPNRGTAVDLARGRLARGIYLSGVISHTRDFRAFHQMLFDHGLAVPAGTPLRPPTGPVPDDLAQVVTRIKGLFGQAVPSP